MFQYKARLKSNKELVCEGHTIKEIEHSVKHFKRMQKKGKHTQSNDVIEIIHIKRNKVFGKSKGKEVLVKEI